MNTPSYDETEEEFKAPEASTPEERLWREKWEHLQTLKMDLWTEVEQLMKKGRIPCKTPEEPDYLDWAWKILPEIFERRLSLEQEFLKRTIAAFHPFIGSTIIYGSGHSFDLPGDALQECAESLLLELRAENASESDEIIVF